MDGEQEFVSLGNRSQRPNKISLRRIPNSPETTRPIIRSRVRLGATWRTSAIEKGRLGESGRITRQTS